MLGHPACQFGMPKLLSRPWLVDLGIHAYADDATRDFGAQGWIVTGSGPNTANRESHHFAGTESAVFPNVSCHGGRNRRTVQCRADVVNCNEHRTVEQRGCDPLAPLIF